MSPSEQDLTCLDEAAAWLVCVRTRELTAEEAARFEAWIGASPENAAAIDLAGRAWTGLGQVEAQAAPLIVRPAVPSAVARRRWNPRAWGWAGGALAAACAMAVWVLAPADTAYHTGAGESDVVQFDDGSRIHLAPDTDLKVHTSVFSRRAVLISGQAEFEIVHDARRPFTVRTRRIVLRDLGTRFAVRDRGGAMHVRLIEGRVRLEDLATNRPLAELRPGEEALIDGAAVAPRVAVGPAAMVPAQPGPRALMLLRDTPLPDALETLEWRTGVDIVLNDPSLAKLRVSGVYATNDVGSFLNALAQIEPIDWRAAGPETLVIGLRNR